MKSKSYKRMIEEYNKKYGNIPSTHDEIMEYLKEDLKLTEKDYQKIQEMDSYTDSIPWNELTIILPVIPKPSPRPRTSAKGIFYVTGAMENKKLFKYYVEEVYQIIYTQTHFSLIAYLPTPTSSMNRWEIYRAENKKIIPTSNPDFDNLLKTYSDMIQGRLLLNDNLVSYGSCEKYYSIKPRVEIHIRYQLGFDSRYNKRRIESSTNYQNAIEHGNAITVYTEGGDFW